MEKMRVFSLSENKNDRHWLEKYSNLGDEKRRSSRRMIMIDVIYTRSEILSLSMGPIFLILRPCVYTQSYLIKREQMMMRER